MKQPQLASNGKGRPRDSSNATQVNAVTRQNKPKLLPEPVYTSWSDYLNKVTWKQLRRKCFDTAKRMNRARLLSAPAKYQGGGLQVWHVMRNAQGRCHHCGSLAVEGRPSNPCNGAPVAWEHIGRRVGSLEHIKGRSFGGDNEFSNLAWSCLLCNNWVAEQERARGISRQGKPDFGAIYPDVRGEHGNKKSNAIIAAKYEAETGKRWSEEEAFAKGPKPPQFDIDDDYGYEMFPDHECPWAMAMYRDLFRN